MNLIRDSVQYSKGRSSWLLSTVQQRKNIKGRSHSVGGASKYEYKYRGAMNIISDRGGTVQYEGEEKARSHHYLNVDREYHYSI